jgi:glyoxylate reductase
MVPMPRVLVTRRLPSVVIDRLAAACTVDLHDGPQDLTPDELLARLAGADAVMAMLTNRFDAPVFDACLPTLKIVANVAVGYDNIDVAAAHDRGITITNTPDVLTDATADLTMGLILDVMRRLAEGDRLIRRDGWHGWAFDFMLGRDLRGKQLGIVGAGRIGRAVAARARAFGMSIAYASRAGRRRADEADARWMSLDELLVTSDVVSLHVPLTAETRHLITQKELARMKRSAFLVNTTRGPVVDEGALAWALREHLIAGAALDVFEREPVVHPDLRPLENVVLVPHLGSATVETRTAMADLAARNILAVLGGGAPLTPVTPPARPAGQ